MSNSSEFKKRDNRVIITCDNVSFPFDSITCGREISVYNREAKGLLEKIQESGYSDETVGNFMTFITQRIENILGIGSVGAIFGKVCGYYDLLDLYNHIVNEYQAFTDFKISQYSGKAAV